MAYEKKIVYTQMWTPTVFSKISQLQKDGSQKNKQKKTTSDQTSYSKFVIIIFMFYAYELDKITPIILELTIQLNPAEIFPISWSPNGYSLNAFRA